MSGKADRQQVRTGQGVLATVHLVSLWWARRALTFCNHHHHPPSHGQAGTAWTHSITPSPTATAPSQSLNIINTAATLSTKARQWWRNRKSLGGDSQTKRQKELGNDFWNSLLMLKMSRLKCQWCLKLASQIVSEVWSELLKLALDVWNEPLKQLSDFLNNPFKLPQSVHLI